MASCGDKKRKPLIKGHPSHAFYGRGLLAFLFEEKEDRDLIFQRGPYLMGSRGMWLNKYILDFNL
jgi:hypothetical protein